MSEPTRPTPEAMRAALADYVRAVHGAYLDAASLLPPAERARLPLLEPAPLTVVAVGTSHLHVVATREALPEPSGQEVALDDELDGVRWTLRFVDPVVLPAVGLLDESQGPAQDQVRRLLGVRTHLYHLAVAPGSGLTAHHAQHAGTGLAHAHAAAGRDYETIRFHARGREALVDDLAGADLAGLPHACAALAARIAPDDAAVASLSLAASPDRVALRRALLDAVRPSSRPAPAPEVSPL
ncbi:MAG: hypothetical protein U0S36_00965 [Candidatus Nanopelagicales bacterium]